MDIKIYYKDTDCGGVVYYANYLAYFEQARTEWMEQKGVSIRDLAGQGILFVVKNAQIDYISPARYGETLEVITETEKISGVSIDFVYNIYEKESSRHIVRGTTKMVCINGVMKPQKMPAEVYDKLLS